MTASKLQSITDVKPQRRNANRHSQRGMGQLEKSVQADGWIGAITVAADGETFDGSARIEVASMAGFDDAIIVESDGTRPIVHVRTDIPTADDPRAARLGIAANRVASVNLEWDVSVLAELHDDGIDLSDFWNDTELQTLLEGAATDMIGEPPESAYREQYGVIVMCESEAEQASIYERLRAEGYTCRVVTT